MKVGYFSPLPPAATGVADYSAALLPHLRALGQVEVGVEVDANQYDVALYHIGNNSLHRKIYECALVQPGVSVLHDAVLQHLLLGALDRDAYIEEMIYNYGEQARELGQQLWQERSRSGADARYFAHPMLKRIATVSRGIIVHNPAAANIVRQHAPSALITEIPHFFSAPALPLEADTLRFRTKLGIGPETLLVGTFGHQRETKRLSVLLRAFHRVIQTGADIRLLVSGGFVSKAFENAIGPLLDHPAILRTGYLPEPDFWRYAAATDLCVNLRYPSAGETSGIAIRMMGIGKPVLFTQSEAVARIPETACIRVDTGPAEEEMLAEYILWLARDHAAVKEIGRRAAEHIACHHAPEKIAQQYWNALVSCR